MGERIRAIDFWRGALQIVILVDHMPGSFLNRATPMNFGFSDALEAFVFLSGISAGLAYLTMESRFGKVAVAYACARRALKIYGVHVAVTLGVFVLFAVAYRISGVHTFAMADLGRDFRYPRPNGLRFSLCNTNRTRSCVLPLYVVLMLWTPIAVVLAARDPRLAVAASFAIYLAARMVSHPMQDDSLSIHLLGNSSSRLASLAPPLFAMACPDHQLGFLRSAPRWFLQPRSSKPTPSGSPPA